jgi:hypothetical protein
MHEVISEMQWPEPFVRPDKLRHPLFSTPAVRRVCSSGFNHNKSPALGYVNFQDSQLFTLLHSQNVKDKQEGYATDKYIREI